MNYYNTNFKIKTLFFSFDTYFHAITFGLEKKKLYISINVNINKIHTGITVSQH